MVSLSRFGFRFTPNWLITIGAVLCIGLFSYLGFWQIERFSEKKQMQEAQAKRSNRKPVFWDASRKNPEQYEHIQVSGHYLDSVFLLDNQHYKHQFGYNVLSPMVLADGSIVMVDRGWLAGDVTRRTLPEVESPETVQTIEGTAYFPSNKQWVLGAGFEEKNDKITIIELLDIKMLTHFLQKKVYPFIIRLDKYNTYGFVREWAIVSMPPERHLAYALQWFVMAFVVLILFVVLNLKKEYEKTNN